MANSHIAAAILATGGKSPSQSLTGPAFDVNRPYQALQRQPATFTQGGFAPQLPMQPEPINEPRDDSGRPDPRRFQYPVGWNLPIGQPGNEGLKLVPFATLRAMADMYSVLRSCIDHRVNEIISMGWDVVPTLEKTQKMKGDSVAREDWEKRRKQVIEFFRRPDSDKAKYPTFEAWLSALLEDRFVIDAQAIHLHPSRRKGAGPFGSNLASLDLLDGATIRPMLDVLGATPGPGQVAYQQYVWGVPRVDLLALFSEKDLEDMPEPEATFTSDQLIYMRDQPRVWTPYGFSCVEKAIQPAFIGYLRQQYQMDYFQEGTVPAQFITPGPEISTPQQIRQLQDALNAMAGDIGAKHRIIVLPPGSKADPQKAIPLADQFDEWIVSQVTMPFEMTPMDLGVTPRVSAVQSPAETKQISEINTNKGSSTRIKPVLAQLKADLFDYVIQQIFKQDDMEWYWGTPESDEVGADIIDMHVTKIKNGMESIDEARIATGQAPWGLPETSVPGVITATGFLPLTVAVQAAVASVSGAPGAPGAPPAPNRPAGPNPNQPAQQQQPAKPPAKVPVLTTPAHEAVRAATGTPPATKSVTEELKVLKRYLNNGKPIEKFETKVLSAEAMAAAEAALPKGVTGAVLAAGQVMSAQMHRSRRTARLAEAIQNVAAALSQLVYDHRNGTVGTLTLLDTATAAIAQGIHDAMSAGSQDASDDFEATPVVDFDREVAQRADRQQGFILGLLHSAMTQGDDADFRSRFDLYGQSLVGAYNSAYGQTVQKAHGDYEIVWELGDAEHCAECLARDGHVYTFATLPGWPGDGDFGGPLCLGGPRCACSLSYREGGQEIGRAENTQRADALAYYGDQNAAIAERRATMAQQRDQFIQNLPGDQNDLSTTAGRAYLRDQLRDEVARLANEQIRQAGGYQGVTFEASDVPADIVVQLLPPNLRNPVYAGLPQITFDEAVQQFVGKVGPKGYIHGWIFVGIPTAGALVHHPQHGTGTVISRHGSHVEVQFHRTGHTHIFAVDDNPKHGTRPRFVSRYARNDGTLPSSSAPAEPRHEPEHPSASALADRMNMGHGPEGMSDEELAAVDHEFARRATALGHDGQVSRSHQKVKDEMARRSAAKSQSRADEFTYENTAHMTDVELGDKLSEFYVSDPEAANRIEEILNRRDAEGMPVTRERWGAVEHDANPVTNPAARPARKLTPQQQAAEQYDQYAMSQYSKALDELNGVLLNDAGKAHARSSNPDLEWQIFRGPWQVANKYASEELQQWWRENGRETMQSFRYGMYQWGADSAAAQNVRLRGHSRTAIASTSDRSQQ